MKEDKALFIDWIQAMTVSDFVNTALMLVLAWAIIVLVARTFRGKSDI